MCIFNLADDRNICKPVAVHIGENLIHPVGGGRFRTHKIVDGFSHLRYFKIQSLCLEIFVTHKENHIMAMTKILPGKWWKTRETSFVWGRKSKKKVNSSIVKHVYNFLFLSVLRNILE